MGSQRQPLWKNLNRLAQVTILLVLLKVFTYLFQDFLPVFGQVVTKAFSALLPFFIALLVAFLMEPLVVRLMRRVRLRRAYAALLALVLALVGVSLLIIIIMARLYTELAELAINLPNYDYLVDFVTKQVQTIEKYVGLNPNIQSTLFAATESLTRSIQEWAKSASLFLLGFLTALPRVFIVLVVSLVATFLVSLSYPEVKKFFAGLIPNRWRSSAQVVSEGLGAAIFGYLRAQTILVSITALGTIIGLLLIGNPYAVTLGVLAGLLDIMPIVGTGMLFVPWIIALLIMGSFGGAVKLLVLWLITLVVRQLLEPKVMSSGIGIHPLPTLISMYVGLQLLGVVGLILGPALVICYEALRKAGLIGPTRQ